jgi:hypothetical protein
MTTMQPLGASGVVKLCVLDWVDAQGRFFCVMMRLCLLEFGSNVGCWVVWILHWTLGKDSWRMCGTLSLMVLQFHFPGIGVDVSF